MSKVVEKEVNENEIRLVCDQNKLVIPIKTAKIPGEKHKPFAIVFEPSPIRKGKTVIQRSVKNIDAETDIIPHNALGKTRTGEPVAGMRILDYLQLYNSYFQNKKIWIDSEHKKLIEDEKKNKKITLLEQENFQKEKEIQKLKATVELLKKDNKKGASANV